MSLTIVPVGQIFGKYEQQARMAELNRKTSVKTIQNQADRVDISPEARKAQVLHIARSVREASKHLSTESKNLDEAKPASPEAKFGYNVMQRAEEQAKEKSDERAEMERKYNEAQAEIKKKKF